MKKSKKPEKPAGKTVSGVDLGEMRRLLDFMAQHGLDEFEYEHAGRRVRLRKAAANSDVAARPQVASAATQHMPVPRAGDVAMPVPPSETAAAEELHVVKSPIVGTYYDAPTPGAPAFVKPGDLLVVGQVLCIIEAMKLMNEIESDVAGVVVRAHVENGQPVEYGAALFSIRPAGK